MTVEKLQLTLHASGLKNVAGLGKGTSDPFAIVTLLATGAGEKPHVLGKTEVIKNTLAPNWTTSFLFDYEFGNETHINISVVDEIRKNSDKPMGSAVFEIGEILGSRGSIKAKKFKKGGTLYARLQKAAPRSAGKLALRMSGIKLKNVEGFLKKSDPFYELRRTHDGPGGGSWTPVYRSKHMKNNLNPKWEPATIDVNTLCDGNLDRQLQVAIFDHESSGKHQSMGTFETTVNQMLKTGEFTPKKSGKSYGTIKVNFCSITGADTATSATVVQPAATAAPAEAEVSFLPMPVPVPVQQFGSMNLGGGVPLPAPPPRKPTFVDYISGNCELNMCVAIDFTGSNGDPRKPGTLHHFSQYGVMNGYEKAIVGVGSILSKYDSDQRFPVWGFGAKYGGVVRHCFQAGKEKEAHGVQGILDAYKSTFQTPLIMSGPTVFTEVIALAAAEARSRHKVKPLSYTLLLLLTDGAVTDVEATKQCLASVADAPLSIVIVGIGNADFSAMQFLDDFEKRSGMQRDIVQFVEFRAHEFNKTSLTRATLEEIPDQLVEFFYQRGIMPQPSKDLSVSRISVASCSDDVDIDLSMDYQSDGEIVLNGDQPGAYIDNSYEGGLGGVHTMQPPTAPGGATAPVMRTGAPPPSQPCEAHAMASAIGYATNPLARSLVANPTSAVPVPPPPQPFTFQVQVPPGVTPGMQLQIAHPKTGQMLIVPVPQGVAPGGVFAVSA